MDGAEYSLPITVAGRVLSFDRRKRWDRHKHGFRRLAVWLMTALTVILGYDTLMQLLASVEAGEWTNLIGVPIVAAGAALTVLFAVAERKHDRRRLQTVWYNEQADQPRLLAGIRFDLYDDRVVRSDLRTTVTLYYRELTAVTETADGFLLQAGNRELVISGVDLTPWQVARVAQQLRQAAAAVYRLKKPAVGLLAEALPVPSLTNTDTVFSRGSITLPRPMPTEAYRREQTRLINGWVVPMTGVLGCTLGCWVPLTSNAAIDLLLFTVVSVAVAWLLVRLGSTRGKRPTTVQLVITRDGIGGFANGASEFLVWSRMRAVPTPQALRLTLPDEIPLSIPWRCLEHPEAVQQLF